MFGLRDVTGEGETIGVKQKEFSRRNELAEDFWEKGAGS
jgi:hypothetical protein